jgi:hypothetical protein
MPASTCPRFHHRLVGLLLLVLPASGGALRAENPQEAVGFTPNHVLLGTHHADVIVIEGQSYRVRESEQERAARRKQP